MFNKIVLGVTALAASFTAMPSAADAHRTGYRHYHEHAGYYDDRYDDPRRFDYNDYRGRDRYYAQRRYNDRYARGRHYDDGRYNGRAYGRYDDRRYYGRRRCGSGTTGAIVGGAGGALLGRSIGRGRDYYGYRRGSGTGGAIIGGAVGALIGREVGRGC